MWLIDTNTLIFFKTIVRLINCAYFCIHAIIILAFINILYTTLLNKCSKYGKYPTGNNL